MTARNRPGKRTASESPLLHVTPTGTPTPSTQDAALSPGNTSSPSVPPWYVEGLRFSCRQCGRCCQGPGGFVWLTEPEANRIAEVLHLPRATFGKRFLRRVCGALALVDGANGDCPFLDPKRGCKIYAVRPAQCKTYPWWPEVVEDEAAWTDAGRNCPGVGHGTRHPLAVIETGLQTHAEEKHSPYDADGTA